MTPNLNDQDPAIEYSTQPELALAALIDMLTRFTASPRPIMACSIAAHLRLVAAESRLPGAVRDAAAQAHAFWQARLRMSEVPACLDS